MIEMEVLGAKQMQLYPNWIPVDDIDLIYVFGLQNMDPTLCKVHLCHI